MGKIVKTTTTMRKKKKKGRPSKLDLDRQSGFRRTSRSEIQPESDLRRSIRRRNLKYTDDQFYEDDDEVSVEEEEEEEEEDERRKEKKKKMKLVLRLADHHGGGVDPVLTRSGSSGGGGGGGSGRRRRGKEGKIVGHHHNHHHQHGFGPESRVGVVSVSGSAASSSSSDQVYGDDDDNKPFKKRRINGGGDDDDDCVYDDDDDEDGGRDDDVGGGGGDNDEVRSVGSDEEQKKETEQNGDLKMMESVPGTGSGVPFRDKKQVELILDKIQKKDIYGVYAEPVDPEELPDYHDVIEHPMDFGTIRKKLETGTYSNLEQLEADIFLLCSNAMQYNAPETVYFKQARTIQELARKKFQRLRNDLKRIEAEFKSELKSEEKTKSNFVVKKPVKKSAWRTVQEPKSSFRTIQEPKSTCRTGQDPVGSDFSSGATLATITEKCNGPNMTHAGPYERPKNVDGLLDGNSSLTENKPEKAEEQLSGKGFPSKFGKKPFVLDENRRTTYNVSSQQLSKSDSTFTIFEDENKQMVAVGLHADHSYERSLARFAATLGPVAWKVASRRIEEALPTGFRFGRGWVGEYEPLPTAVLTLENNAEKHLFTNLENKDMSRKKNQIKEGLKTTQDEVPLGLRTVNSLGVTVTSKLPDLTGACHFSGHMLKGSPGSIGIAGPKPMVSATSEQQNPVVTSSVKSDNNVLKQVELNCSSSASADTKNIVSGEQPMQSSDVITSRMIEMFSRNRNLVQPIPFKLPEADGVVAGGLPSGKTVGSSSNNHNVSSFSSDFISNIKNRAATYGNHEQALSDPVQMLRMLAEKTQNQQKSSNRPTNDAPQVTPSVRSSRRDDSSAAGSAAQAHSWMTLGVAQSKTMDNSGSPKIQIPAPSPYNPAGELRSVSQVREESPASAGLRWQLEKKMFQPQAFSQVREEPQFQNNRPMFFPQLVRSDHLSRFQVPSPWRGLAPHIQLNKKQDTLPPDLNIGFQSSGSPVKQSSGRLVDSQQPDLALQL